jgi:O-antigen/teichoic acid export membrane protein
MAASSIVAIAFTRKDLVFGLVGDLPLREYIRFGVPLALATALNSTPKQLDILVIQAYFGSALVGVYSQGKNFYRIFEQAFDAATTLLYPAAVRIRSQHRDADMATLVTKAISVTLIPTIVVLAILELGGSNVLPMLFGPKFAPVVVHFNVLIIAALGMPFLLMSSILAAYGQSFLVVRYSAIGMIISVATLFAVGELGQPLLVGLALVVNAWVVGILCTIGVRSLVPFPWSSVWRSVGDFKGLVRSVRGGA